MNGAALADAAQMLVGSRYLLHGRNPEVGIDCIGLVLAALRAIGLTPREPPPYALRNRTIAPHRRIARAMGFEPASQPAKSGDIVLVAPGAAQFHLLVAARDGQFIHAHAGLRRVVMTPGPICWPIAGHWRLPPQS
ncbi:MAG: NlpC/P60 family protein [Caenibius sp.]